MSQTAISRIWRAFGLKPHLQETWKLSTDPQFIDKVRDIVGLYLDPPERALVLTDEERQTLVRWSRRATTAQALALRCKIVLACAEGATNKAVAERLGIWPQTVTKWRGRFVRDRLDGLADEPRPGRPRTIADEQVEQVITKTLEEPPPNHDTHWSTRSMARATGLSQSAISRIWRAFGLNGVPPISRSVGYLAPAGEAWMPEDCLR